ncbi:ABC transporter permease, partial [Leucobacter sp. M11]|uniref:ABC transporter permease n=1 Tax=Leucobacter sp. M11 TaxID=2993565 RepID=UPI002D7FBE80
TPLGPLAVDPGNAFAPPGPGHPLGTDQSGRDVLSRIAHGSRASLAIGLASTAIGVGLGGALGMIAGLGGRVADRVVGRVIEALFAFPGLLLALLLIAVRGPGVVTVTVAVGLSTAPGYARIIRGSIRQARASGFVTAARLQGDPGWRIALTRILPHTLGPLGVLAALGVGQAVLTASALSYLGLGAPPPAPEWGAMLNAGRPYLESAWWLTVFPGLAILAVGVATAVLGQGQQHLRRVR